MLLYLREYKLAEHLRESDIKTFPKVFLFIFFILIVLYNIFMGIINFPSNILLIIFLISLIPTVIKNRNITFFKHATYLSFPIAIKAWLITCLLMAISFGIFIGILSYSNANMGSMMDEMLNLPVENRKLTFYEKHIEGKEADEILNIINPMILAIVLIFIRWRYIKCLRIIGKYNV